MLWEYALGIDKPVLPWKRSSSWLLSPGMQWEAPQHACHESTTSLLGALDGLLGGLGRARLLWCPVLITLDVLLKAGICARVPDKGARLVDP